MTRRALLIGSETYGLQGCNADVALMRDMLGSRGFDEIVVRTGSDATRSGIIDGLDDLVASIRDPADAVVLYYSGHGGRVARPDFAERQATGASVHFQFIVPFDMDESAPEDFRGLLSEELSWNQRRLTDAFVALGAVPNVTTILDCCHSGYMARGADTVPKSVDLADKMFRMRGIREHALALTHEIHGLATNADAVRLAACQPEQSAFEFPSARGGRHGALTDALATVLEQLGDAPVSWSVVGDLVRRRVRALVPEQRPDVEGPSDRLLFSGRSMPSGNVLSVSTVEDDLRIEAAALLGIELGDGFDLVAVASGESLAAGEVVRIDGADAVLRIDPESATDAVGRGAVAVPTKLRRPRAPVQVGIAGGDALRNRLAASTRLVEATDETTALVRIADTSSGETAGGLVLNDHAGQRWRVGVYPNDDTGIDRLVEDIEAIAVGHRLLDLSSGEGPNTLDPVVTIDFGTYEDGTRRRLALHGERLAVGSPLYLTVANTGTDPVFVWVFDVGVSGRSSLLTNAAPSGTLLGASGAEDDTTDLWDLDGEPLTWPADVPTTASGGTDPARWERFVVLVADQRGDLSSLASRRPSARSVSTTELEALIDEARTGVREIAPPSADAAALRYRIEIIEFLLAPA